MSDEPKRPRVALELVTCSTWRHETPTGTRTVESDQPVPALLVSDGSRLDPLEVIEGMLASTREQMRAEIVDWLRWNLPEDPADDSWSLRVVREAATELEALDVLDPIELQRAAGGDTSEPHEPTDLDVSRGQKVDDDDESEAP